jgi:hypothetical protein
MVTLDATAIIVSLVGFIGALGLAVIGYYLRRFHNGVDRLTDAVERLNRYQATSEERIKRLEARLEETEAKCKSFDEGISRFYKEWIPQYSKERDERVREIVDREIIRFNISRHEGGSTSNPRTFTTNPTLRPAANDD